MHTYIRSVVVALTATALALTLGPLAPAQAESPRAAAKPPAGRLVYVCGADLCAVDASTGGTQQLTSDAGGYANPDITRDGQTVVAQRGSTVVVGPYGTNLNNVWVTSRDINDVAVAPDGSGVAESHSYVQNETVLCWPGPSLCLSLVAHNETAYSVAGSSAAVYYDGGGGAGFLGVSTLLSSRYVYSDDTHRICRVDNPGADGATCTDVVISTNTLSSPAGSPDGQTIAVGVSAEGQSTSSVQLFSASTGALVRVVAENAASPTFSPDGGWLAYASADGWIYAVPTAGGAPVRLVRGSAPAWGGASISGGSSPATGTVSVVKRHKLIKVKRNRFTVALACKASTACKGKVKAKVGKKKIAKPARYRVKAGKRSKVTLRLTKKGIKVLRKKRHVKATLLVGGKRVKVRLAR